MACFRFSVERRCRFPNTPLYILAPYILAPAATTTYTNSVVAFTIQPKSKTSQDRIIAVIYQQIF